MTPTRTARKAARRVLDADFLARRGAVLAPLLAAHAPLVRLPFVPELLCFAAPDELPLWTALDAVGLGKDAPFFAVAWPGAQAVARAVLDGVIDVCNRVVVDIGCGSGLAAIAAAKAGAARVVAVDVDENALVCAALLAAENGVADRVSLAVGDATDVDVADDVDVVLAGDLVYNADVGRAFAHALSAWSARGPVFVADSGRPFFDPGPLTELCAHDIDVPVAVEGKPTRRVRLYGNVPTIGRGGGAPGSVGHSA